MIYKKNKRKIYWLCVITQNKLLARERDQIIEAILSQMEESVMAIITSTKGVIESAAVSKDWAFNGIDSVLTQHCTLYQLLAKFNVARFHDFFLRHSFIAIFLFILLFQSLFLSLYIFISMF